MNSNKLELPQWLIDWVNAAPIHIIDLSKKKIDNDKEMTDTKDNEFGK